MAEKISKSEVNYEFVGRQSDERCGTCVMFEASSRSCTLVAGIIRPLDTCDRWEPKEDKVSIRVTAKEVMKNG